MSVTGPKAHSQALQPSDWPTSAASAQTTQTVPPGPHSSRPTLPPLSYLQAGSQIPPSPSSASPTSYSRPSGHVASSQYTSPSFPQTYPSFGQSGGTASYLPIRGSESDYYARSQGAGPGSFIPPRGQFYNPLKRPHETPESVFERSVSHWTSTNRS